MPRPFAITSASNSVFLDEDRQGEAGFTVSNQSGHSIEGRARLVAEDSEAESWIALRGSAQRSFATAGTEQYAVEIDVPPDAPSGNYELRLDMVGEERPDEQHVEGPTVTFQVPETEPQSAPFPWKIVAAIATVLLIGGGVLAYNILTDDVSVRASFAVDPEAPIVGDEIRLDAAESTVTGADDLTYFWKLSPPGESDAILSSTRGEATRFTADVQGVYEIALEVSAGKVSDSDTTTISADMPTEEIQTEETHAGLAVQLAAPGAVEQNGDFEIRAAITNRRSEAVTLTFSNSCLMYPDVYDDEEMVPFRGTRIFCLFVLTDRELSAGETLESSYDVAAELENGGEVDPGTYAIRMMPNVRAIDGDEATLPAVEQDLIVF